MTTPRPWRAEPSRCIATSRHVLEILVVDLVEARRFDRQPQQLPTIADNGCGGVRAHVTLGIDARMIGADGLDRFHARDGLELFRHALTLRLRNGHSSQGPDLKAKPGERAKQRDVSPR